MALSKTYEHYPCEDERYLNGLHIQKAFRNLYDVRKIDVEPQVKAADCPEIEDEVERKVDRVHAACSRRLSGLIWYSASR